MVDKKYLRVLDLNEIIALEEGLIEELSKAGTQQVYSLLPENNYELKELLDCYDSLGEKEVNVFRMDLGYITNPTVDPHERMTKQYEIVNRLMEYILADKECTYLLKSYKRAVENIK